eukprot:36198_1
MVANGNDKYNGKIFTKKKCNGTSNDNYIGLEMNLMGYPAEKNGIHGLVTKFHEIPQAQKVTSHIPTPTTTTRLRRHIKQSKTASTQEHQIFVQQSNGMCSVSVVIIFI